MTARTLHSCRSARLLLAATFAALALAPLVASAAVPTTSHIEGFLMSSGGAAAADGDYQMTFAIYASKTAQTAAWTEGPVSVKVAGGRFSHLLGSTTALDAKALAGLSEAWVGVKVAADPELPRQPLASAPYALVAESAMTAAKLSCTNCISADQIAGGGISAAKVGFNYAASSTKGGPALDLTCTGCVSVAELKFDGDVDLGGNSLKASNGTFSGDLTAKTVTATSFVGDGSKLTGIKTASGTCDKAGEVVKGIKADGSLICVAALDPSALPADGLNEISNDLLSNQYIDTISADKKNVPIPDNTGAEGVSDLTFPDIGTAQTFAVTINVKNTALNKVAITLLPPNDKKVGYVLCDPCAKDETVKQFTITYPTTAPKSGDLSAWIGKNPKGLWNLKVKDTEFCVPQKPGNSGICDVANKTDGVIVDWSIKIQTLSNQKVAVNADLLANKDATFSGGLTIKGSTGTCDASTKGQLRWMNGKGLLACDGAFWVAARAMPAVYQGYCSHSRDESNTWNWYCLDKTAINNATDYLTVSTYAPPNVSDSYDSQWQDNANGKKIGRVEVKIPGYYRVSFYSRTQCYTNCYAAIYMNGSTVVQAQEQDANYYYDHTFSLSKAFKAKKGDYFEFRGYANTDNGSAYSFFSGPTNSYVQIEYLGTDW